MTREEKLMELSRILPKIRETLKKERLLRQATDFLPLTSELEARMSNSNGFHSSFEKMLSDLRNDIESDIRLYSYILRAIFYGKAQLQLQLSEIQEEFLIEYVYLLSFVNGGGNGPHIYKEDLFEDPYTFIALLLKNLNFTFTEKFHKIFSKSLYGDIRNDFFEILV